ncbi:MAG: complement resistance protein TraT [Gemmatimonadota bacterium]|nr:complement resistance protein TraT [Gemmatimonadota bacterium]MDH5759174.1 complement resistance protein TraT [Gemmatimonadota bacterium]
MRSTSTHTLVAVAVALATFTVPRVASAQSAPPTLEGAAWGVGSGGVVTLGLLTLGSRMGHFHHSPNPLVWEILPVPLAVAGGTWLARNDHPRFGESVRGGLLGFGTGAVVGALLGPMVGDDGTDAWAGAIMGGAVGLLAGTAMGLARTPDAGEPWIVISLILPVGP